MCVCVYEREHQKERERECVYTYMSIGVKYDDEEGQGSRGRQPDITGINALVSKFAQEAEATEASENAHELQVQCVVKCGKVW